MIYNIKPKTMIATKMKVEIIPPYTADTFNTYWEIITASGKIIDRGNMAVPLQYMPLFISVIQSIDSNGDVIGDETRAYLNAILSDPNIDLPLADLPIPPIEEPVVNEPTNPDLGATQSDNLDLGATQSDNLGATQSN
jgi:hypothetical protein